MNTFFYSNNPVLDAESYFSRQEEEAEKEGATIGILKAWAKKNLICSCCGSRPFEIFSECDDPYPDDILCEECAPDGLKEFSEEELINTWNKEFKIA